MHSPELGRREVVYENEYQQVYRVAANFGTFRKNYFVTDYGQRAGLVAVKGRSMLLVQQYRLLVNGFSWEIPGGKVDDDETAEEAAVRECFEETGVRCKNLKPVLIFHPGLDTLNNPTHLFYSRNFVETVRTNFHGHEARQHAWVPLEDCLKMVLKKEIVDSLSIIGLLGYQVFVGKR
jgi:8-oxo-dGTP pyrophosphatase MutT (NUDIX family)